VFGLSDVADLFGLTESKDAQMKHDEDISKDTTIQTETVTQTLTLQQVEVKAENPPTKLITEISSPPTPSEPKTESEQIKQTDRPKSGKLSANRALQKSLLQKAEARAKQQAAHQLQSQQAQPFPYPATSYYGHYPPQPPSSSVGLPPPPHVYGMHEGAYPHVPTPHLPMPQLPPNVDAVYPYVIS
jgi:hypothetical protein